MNFAERRGDTSWMEKVTETSSGRDLAIQLFQYRVVPLRYVLHLYIPFCILVYEDEKKKKKEIVKKNWFCILPRTTRKIFLVVEKPAK